MTAPVQVLVVGYEHPRFSGEVLAEFRRLRAAGVVRLLDVLLVWHTDDGRLETVDVDEQAAMGLGEVAMALLGRPQDDRDAEAEMASVWSLVDTIPVGTAAAVALIEHTWAEPLVDAIGQTGGQLLDDMWLAKPDLALLGELMNGVER